MDNKIYVLDSDLLTKAQTALNEIGTDVSTFVNNMIKKVANNELSTQEIEQISKPQQSKKHFSELFDIYSEKIWMAEDFNEPMDWIVDELV